MAILKILHVPDERLRKSAELVKEVNSTVRRIAKDMLDTMYFEEGIGLAATQVNIHQRIIVIDISKNRREPLVLINPELLRRSGEVKTKEGCLSIPKESAFVSRAERVKICAFNLYGSKFELEADGLLSICVQHEIDHLSGKLFIDYLSPIEQKKIYNRVRKLNQLHVHA